MPSLDAARDKRCFQFAHGTMRGHTLAGEERFALEWDR